MENNEPCEGCQATLRKTQIISTVAGLALGAGLTFVVVKYVLK
jgi:hypothetical protein